MRPVFGVLAFATALVLGSLAPAQDSRGSWVVKAKLVVPVEGAPVEGGAVRISGAKIDAIGAATNDAGVPAVHVVDFPEGIVYPGLVDAGSYLGIRRERDDQTRAFQPRNRIAEAFDPLNPGFERNLSAGITTVHLVPGNTAVIGGRTAVVKVGAGGTYRVLAADAGLKLSLVEDAYPDGRAPTSLIGAMGLLREPSDELAKDLEPWRAGAKTVFVSAATNREVLLASGLKTDLGFKTVLVTDMNCGRFSKEVREGAAAVILDSLALQRQPYEWRNFGDLIASDVPIAFATWTPLKSPGALRLNAVIAVRQGVPPDRALRALTIDAAKILGVDASVGSLKAGKDADLIVLSAPIEDPRARLLLCVQDGKVVFPGPEGITVIKAAALAALLIALAPVAGAQDVGSIFTIRAERLYIGDGRVIAPGVLTVENGKIVAVGPATDADRSHEVFSLDDASITPGFIEGSSTVGLPKGLSENEENAEVTPCVRAGSVLDPSDEGFRRMRESGVTTLIIAPGNRNVIGGLAVAAKSREGSARDLVLREDLALKAVLGSEPTARNSSPRGGSQSLYARRPNSRMGVIYEMRRAFQEGCERNDNLPMGKSCFCDADGKLLARVMKGDIPIAFVSHAEQDIIAAINIADEFKAPKFYLEGAFEAYLTRALLAKRGIPVLIGPVYHSAQIPEGGGGGRRGGGGQGPAVSPLTDRGGILGGPRLLRDAGVQFGLSQGGTEAGSTLLDYARAAVRGGLTPGEAIAAISGWPAGIVGVKDRVGTIAVGKDADLNVFSGDPMSPTARLMVVVIDGKVVFRVPKPPTDPKRS